MTPLNKGRRYPAEVLEPAEVRAPLDQLSRRSKCGIRNRALVVFPYKSGLRVSEICKLLGHSSISVTARYLDHLTNGVAIEALERADLPDLPELEAQLCQGFRVPPAIDLDDGSERATPIGL